MIPSIAPDQSRRCAICGTYQSVLPGHEEHHWIPRSLGGKLTVILCVRCHNRTEGADPWTVAVTNNVLYVLARDGAIIVERYQHPRGWDQGHFLARLQQAPAHLSELSAQFRFLDDDGIAAAAEALGELEQVGWTCRARLFRTAILRTPYGSKTERLQEVARLFGLERRQAWKEARALEVLDEHPEVVHAMHNLPSPDAVLIAAAHGDPGAALELLADRRNQNPRYGPSDLRAELQANNTDSLRPPPAWCVCPTCGKKHLEGAT